MIKILYLYPQLERSGPTNQLFNIIKNLDKSKFTPVVLLLRNNNDKDILSIFNEVDIPVYSLGMSSYFDLIRVYIRMRKIISEYSPDIIHSTQLFPDLLVMFVRGCVRITTVRGDLPVLYHSKYGKLSYLIGRIHLYFISVNKSIKIISCSESIKDTLNTKYSISSESIPNGVNEEQYFPLDKIGKKKLRKVLMLSEEENIFISTGSLDERKDMDTVIRGFLISKAVSSSILLILGSGPKYDELKKTYGDNCKIKIVGHVNNVVDYLQASDYFLSASYSEGLPNAVLEAMSCGLVTVLSDIPPHQEVMKDSSLGWFFKPGDHVGLSSCINEVIEKKYLDISKKTQDIVQSEFSAKIMSEKYQLLYSSLI